LVIAVLASRFLLTEVPEVSDELYTDLLLQKGRQEEKVRSSRRVLPVCLGVAVAVAAGLSFVDLTALSVSVTGGSESLLHWASARLPHDRPPANQTLGDLFLAFLWSLLRIPFILAFGIVVIGLWILLWIISKLLIVLGLLPYHNFLLGGLAGAFAYALRPEQPSLPLSITARIDGIRESSKILHGGIARLAARLTAEGIGASISPPTELRLDVTTVSAERTLSSLLDEAEQKQREASRWLADVDGQFEAAVSAFTRLVARYREVNRQTQRTRRPALLDFADQVDEAVDIARQRLMEGELSGYDGLVGEIEGLLSDLEAGVSTSGTGEAATEDELEAETLDPYAILGVQRNASEREVRDAWRIASLAVNSDQRQDVSEYVRRQLQEQWKKVNMAYDAIKRERGWK
jgi:uncharacterized membrane protein